MERTKVVYQLDDNDIFVGEAEADLDPMAPENFPMPLDDDTEPPAPVYLIPAGCVEVAPPAHVDGKLRRFVAGAWEYQDIPLDPEHEPPTPEEIEASKVQAAELAIMNHMNTAARAKGYDNILSASSYAALPEGAPFQAEGAAFNLWRAKCWAKAYEILADVKAAQRSEPSIDELIAELPLLELPA